MPQIFRPEHLLGVLPELVGVAEFHDAAEARIIVSREPRSDSPRPAARREQGQSQTTRPSGAPARPSHPATRQPQKRQTRRGQIGPRAHRQSHRHARQQQPTAAALRPLPSPRRRPKRQHRKRVAAADRHLVKHRTSQGRRRRRAESDRQHCEHRPAARQPREIRTAHIQPPGRRQPETEQHENQGPGRLRQIVARHRRERPKQ